MDEKERASNDSLIGLIFGTVLLSLTALMINLIVPDEAYKLIGVKKLDITGFIFTFICAMHLFHVIDSKKYIGYYVTGTIIFYIISGMIYYSGYVVGIYVGAIAGINLLGVAVYKKFIND